MNLRTKEYDLVAGAVRQIKVMDIQAPLRLLVESGSFTYDVLINQQVVSSGTAVSSGVLTPPGGAWGSEIRINCVTAGKLHIAHMG
jgi:hypothetical protein